MLLVVAHLMDRFKEGIVGSDESQSNMGKKTQAKPSPDALYQVKITLLESRPPIWRRIQFHDCTLDTQHEDEEGTAGLEGVRHYSIT